MPPIDPNTSAIISADSRPSFASATENPAPVGALAGKPEVRYVTDANGKVIADPNQPTDTLGAKGRRLAAHALEGLAAGAQVPQQKSGGASALSGLGAGFTASQHSMSAADQDARKKAQEDYAAQ